MVGPRLLVLVLVAVAVVGACSDSRTERRERPAPEPAPPRPDPHAPAERELELSVSRVMPVLGPAGQWVYVFGAGFLPGQTWVELGGAAPTIAHVYDASQLAFTVPAGAHGTGPVTVIIPGARAVSPDRYTVGIPTRPPQVGGLSPDQGAPGTTVVATGDHFVSGQTTIVVDGLETPGHVYGPDSLWFTVPPGAIRSGPVTIRTPNGAATTAAPFRVAPP